MTFCFPHCSCNCRTTDSSFDSILATETSFGITVEQLATSNIGWFCNFDDLRYCNWQISKLSGVYALWHKDEYCPQHKLYHCKALYVGKGFVQSRIFNHAQKKDFGSADLVYFSYIEVLNRQAKYIEQLLLDLYDFPLNISENSGRAKLCLYLTQSAVD